MDFMINKEYPLRFKNSAALWIALFVLEIFIAGLVIISPLSALVVAAGAPVLLLLLVKPEYALYVLVLLIIPGPSITFTMGEVTLNIAHVFVFVVLSSWIIARLAKTCPHISGTGVNQPLLIFWTWALLSILWSHNRIVGIEDVLKLSVSVATVFLIVACVRGSNIFRIVLGIFIVMGLIDAVIAISSTYTAFSLKKEWTFLESVVMILRIWVKHMGREVAGGRGTGFFVPHSTAVTLSFAITFCLMFFLITWNKKKRMMLMGLTILLFAAIIGTLTKSMVPSVLIGASYISLHLKPLRQRFFTVLFVICLLIIVSFALTRFQTGILFSAQRLAETAAVQSSDGATTSVSGRIEVTQIGLQKLWETGGLGTGIGGFLQYTSNKNMDGSHPAVLWDLGFVGIAVWIWLLTASFRLFVTAVKACNNEYYRRMLIVYIGGYVNVLIAWFFTFAYADIYLWFYLGIGFALVHLSRTVPFDPNLHLPYSGNGESIVII